MNLFGDTRETALYKLFGVIFSPEELRIFFGLHYKTSIANALPERASLDELSFSAVSALERKGLIDESLFSRLIKHLPSRSKSILDCAARCGAVVGGATVSPEGETLQLPDVTLPSMAELRRALQGPGSYRDGVLALRAQGLLHAVIAMRLAEFLAEIDASLHVRPAGSEGALAAQIDVLCYLPGRSLIQLSVFTHAEQNLVFRQATGLYGSDADTIVAILIDPDVDPRVAADYAIAVPGGRFTRIFLRSILLDDRQDETTEVVKELIAEAQYRSGDIHSGGLSCVPSQRELRPNQVVRVHFAGVSQPQSVQLSLRSPEEDPVVFAAFDIAPPGCEHEVRIPNSPTLKVGPCRLEARLHDGRRAACRVTMLEQAPSPKLLISPSRCAIGDSVTVTLVDLPGAEPTHVMCFNGSIGSGVVELPPRPADQPRSATFVVPMFLHGERMTNGYHKLTVTEGFVQVEGFLYVEGAVNAGPRVTLRRGDRAAIRREDVSLVMGDIEIGASALHVGLELMTFSNGLRISGWHGAIVRFEPQGRKVLMYLSLVNRTMTGLAFSPPLAPRIVHPYSLEFPLARTNFIAETGTLSGDGNYALEIMCQMLRETHHMDPFTINMSLSPSEIAYILAQAVE